MVSRQEEFDSLVQKYARVMASAIRCRRCSEDYQVLARTHAEVSPVRRRFDPRVWAAAAVIAFALAAGLFVARRDRSQPEAVRGNAVTIGTLVIPADGTELQAA